MLVGSLLKLSKNFHAKTRFEIPRLSRHILPQSVIFEAGLSALRNRLSSGVKSWDVVVESDARFAILAGAKPIE